MKYDRDHELTLSSYIRDYIVLYGRVHPRRQTPVTDYEKEVIRNAFSSLSEDIRGDLSNMSKVIGLTSLEEFKCNIKRYENELAKRPKSETKIDTAAMTKLFNELNDGFDKRFKDIEQVIKTQNVKATAAVIRPNFDQSQKKEFKKPRFSSSYHRTHFSPNQSYRNPNHNRRYSNHNQGRNNRVDYCYNNKPMNPMLPSSSRDDNDTTNRQQQYENIYGKVPGPCHHCQANHFNKHCPLNDDNLKVKG